MITESTEQFWKEEYYKLVKHVEELDEFKMRHEHQMTFLNRSVEDLWADYRSFKIFYDNKVVRLLREPLHLSDTETRLLNGWRTRCERSCRSWTRSSQPRAWKDSTRVSICKSSRQR